MKSEGFKTSVTLYRRGDMTMPAPVFQNAYETIFNRALGPLSTSSANQVRLTSGQIDFDAAGNYRPDIRRNDFLVDTQGRVFLVVQVCDWAAMRRFLVAEIFRPIPDDFDCGSIETFWSKIQPMAWENVPTVSELHCAGVASATPAGVPFLYQDVVGEFDVIAQLQCAAGSNTADNRIVIKAAAADDSAWALVGVRDNGTPYFFHAEHDGASDSATDGMVHVSSVWGWVRLRRVGCRFAAYYSTTTTEPTKDSDWVEMFGSNVWITQADVRLGLAAWVNGTPSSPGFKFKFLRNWMAAR